MLIPKRWQNKLEYAPATNQTIHVSNIKVDWMKPEQRDRPFVYRDKPCGLPGLYMQLTPKYLTDVTVAQQYGTYEKVRCRSFHSYHHYFKQFIYTFSLM